MTSPIIFNIKLEVLANTINWKKENKVILSEKEEIKLSVYRRHDCLYRTSELMKKILDYK